MSQHDYNIADQEFPAFRTDMNNAFVAGQTKNSGDTSPGVTHPFMWWVDTSPPDPDTSDWKVRSESNGAWVTVGSLDNTVWTPFFQGTAMANACIKEVGTDTGKLPPAEAVVLKGGATMTGALQLSGNPTHVLHAVPKQYADSIVGVPTGMMLPYAGGDVPIGYLLCDGQAVSRATFSALFAKIGTTFGAGDNVNTFNVPDMRDRNAVGASGTKARGTTGGAASITTVPPHTHNVDLDTGTFGDHSHTYNDDSHLAAGGGTIAAGGNFGTTAKVTGITGAHFHDVIGPTNNTGTNIAGGAVSVQNPYTATPWMIKT